MAEQPSDVLVLRPAPSFPQEGFMNVGSKESGSSSYVTVSQLPEMKPYPGVDYLGAGYDIFHGNPQGDGVYMLDPGFRQPVRNMQYSPKWLTRDAKFTTPVGSYSLPKFSCTRSEDYSNIASAESYAEALSVDASVGLEYSGIGWGGAFSASVGYNKATNEARESNYYRFDSKSYCLKYYFAWLRAVPSIDDLTPQFRYYALEALDLLKGRDPSSLPFDCSSAEISRLQLSGRSAACD